MQIISHRGYWKNFEKENNQKIAFERSFDLGFGTETDLRDIKGEIVISHNMPNGEEMSFRNFLGLMKGRNLPLALNIKADGQIAEILKILKEYNHTNYFTFDMSIPDMVVQLNTEAKVYTGYSDILTVPVLLDKACGVWLDSFNKPCWFTEDIVNSLLQNNKQICIVSEDLHNRDVSRQWALLKSFSNINNDRLMLCTNFPEDAANFFGEKNEN